MAKKTKMKQEIFQPESNILIEAWTLPRGAKEKMGPKKVGWI
jgi:hypothetical protein